MTIRGLIRCIVMDRWHLVRECERIRQYQHPFKDGKITIAGDLDLEVVLSVMKVVLKKAGLDDKEV